MGPGQFQVEGHQGEILLPGKKRKNFRIKDLHQYLYGYQDAKKVLEMIEGMSLLEAADLVKAMEEKFGVSAAAADRIIQRSYTLQGLISFFTVGEDEVRAWTIRRATPAVDAAEVIHSDIKKGFIRAEVLAYDDLMAAGSYAEARKQGTTRLEGKLYEVQDGDIINFRFNV